jgi:hypothetical protein
LWSGSAPRALLLVLDALERTAGVGPGGEPTPGEDVSGAQLSHGPIMTGVPSDRRLRPPEAFPAASFSTGRGRAVGSTAGVRRLLASVTVVEPDTLA